MSVIFDAELLTERLHAVRAPSFTFSLKGETMPCLIHATGREDYRSILMPMSCSDHKRQETSLLKHTFYFKTEEQAKEALGLQIACTNVTVGQDGKPICSFVTSYPLGPITQIALKQETQAIRVTANSPLEGTRRKYAVSFGQIGLVAVAFSVISGLMIGSATFDKIIAGFVVIGIVAWCSNDILPLLRSVDGEDRHEDEEGPITHV